MAPSLLNPPGHLSPAASLQLSQRAPTVLAGAPEKVSSSPFSSLLGASESPETWLKYENLLLACLRTGDDQSAHQCLERLVARFGDNNERILALKGLVKEAGARNNGELEQVLKDYDTILAEDSANIPVTKRRIALLRSMGRTTDAANALNALLDFSPTDAEAWSELADIYTSQGLYPQAIYALEEVLTLMPNAWNIHARLGEVLFMAATAQGAAVDVTSQRYLAESVKRFARSIELCDDYLRGYYGLKLVVKKLLNDTGKPVRTGAEDFEAPDRTTLEKLDAKATAKLLEIVRRSTAREPGWRGYDDAEVAAANELLAKEKLDVQR